MFDLRSNQMSVVAGADLSPASCRFHAITINGTIAANTALAFGVLRNTPKLGEFASIVYEGITKVSVGAAVTTPGYPLTITASGWFIAASSGGSHVGRILAAANSGDTAAALLDFTQVAQWAGA